VVEMLEADEKIFLERNSVKMEYVLDATEEEGREYYDLFQITQNELYTGELKTLYLMLDQRPKDGNVRKSDELLQYIKSKRKDNAETIYLLSNFLKAGSMLGEKRLFENYRLIADIILLGGNRGGEDRHRPSRKCNIFCEFRNQHIHIDLYSGRKWKSQPGGSAESCFRTHSDSRARC
jgi:hypothetical protein